LIRIISFFKAAWGQVALNRVDLGETCGMPAFKRMKIVSHREHREQ
jgi:hypothetical protein